jgi:hypothetical protein
MKYKTKMGDTVKCRDCPTVFVKTAPNRIYCTKCAKINYTISRDKSKRRRRCDPIFWEKELRKRRKSNLVAKIKALTHYGKGGRLTCCWRGCEVSDIDCLSLDHINDDGAEQRAAGIQSSNYLCRRVIRLGYPDGFQTLCHNHQWKKEILRRKRKYKV